MVFIMVQDGWEFPARFLRDKPVKRMLYLYEHAFGGQRDNREGCLFLARFAKHLWDYITLHFR